MADREGGLGVDRRRFLEGLACAAAVGACGDRTAPGGGGRRDTGPTSTDTATFGGACVVIPEETTGPFPADGSNGPDARALAGILRSDLRTSLATGNVADGLPMLLRLKVTDVGDDCAPLAGWAVYVWHCDREGRYSLYSPGVRGEDWLRGVQETDAGGEVLFTTVFPGAYGGRWPHVHFEVYRSVEDALGGGTPVATSQIALPEAACLDAYATDAYAGSAENFGSPSLVQDNVFSDTADVELASVTGDAGAGFVARFSIGVAG
jgi:protocatechuate 3,4-dioxygenase beta subunit